MFLLVQESFYILLVTKTEFREDSELLVYHSTLFYENKEQVFHKNTQVFSSKISYCFVIAVIVQQSERRLISDVWFCSAQLLTASPAWGHFLPL